MRSAVQRVSGFDTILLHPALAGHIRHISMFRAPLSITITPSAPDSTAVFRYNLADIVFGTDPELPCCAWAACEYGPGLIHMHSV